MNGFINLYKPAGMTSQSAVNVVKRLLPRKTPIGHGGTLDPDAEGILPVCIGKATRLFDYIVDKRKVYVGGITLGITTDTDDASGNVIDTCAVNAGQAELKAVLNRFVGEISQVPPMYSALKKGGEPLYKLARKGITLELEPRKVNVYRLDYVRQNGENSYELEIECGKGVYIRSLMRDIGACLGCGAHMSSLARVRAGAFDVRNAVTTDKLSPDNIEELLFPMDYLLGAYESVTVPADMREKIMNGVQIPKEYVSLTNAAENQIVKLYVGCEFAGMGYINADGGVTIKCMLLERTV